MTTPAGGKYRTRFASSSMVRQARVASFLCFMEVTFYHVGLILELWPLCSAERLDARLLVDRVACARPCAPDACARPSSSQSAHPRPPDSSTPCSTSASCACDPTALSLPASASRSPRPSPIRAETPRNSRPCPAAQSSASPRSPPASLHRSRSAALAAARDRPARPTPRRIRLEHNQCRSLSYFRDAGSPFSSGLSALGGKNLREPI